MRSYNPEDEDDQESLVKLKAENWQVELLSKNPNYPHWGNYEDYMSGKDKGWASPIELDTFKGHWELDDYNEIVNFYFEIYRKSHTCPHCKGEGLNSATKKISEDWYNFDNDDYIIHPNGGRHNNAAWQYHITDDEVYELIKHDRLSDLTDYRGYYDEETKKWMGWVDGERIEVPAPRPEQIPSAKKVNHWAAYEGGIGHDAINKWVCVEQRAKRLGVYGKCEHCDGEGHIYDEDFARVALQLWILHPRKGCSRGVYIKSIEENEIPEIVEYLKGAAIRNAERFSKL